MSLNLSMKLLIHFTKIFILRWENEVLGVCPWDKPELRVPPWAPEHPTALATMKAPSGCQPEKRARLTEALSLQVIHHFEKIAELYIFILKPAVFRGHAVFFLEKNKSYDWFCNQRFWLYPSFSQYGINFSIFQKKGCNHFHCLYFIINHQFLLQVVAVHRADQLRDLLRDQLRDKAVNLLVDTALRNLSTAQVRALKQ